MKKLFAFVVVLCFGLFSAVALAQDPTKGSIGGTVTDQNGAAVPGATVTITGGLNERTVTTDSNGSFKADNLTPGAYSIKVTNTGFKTAAVEAVTVLIGKEQALAIKLEPGEVTATVTVTGAAAIDQAKTEASSNLNDQLFNNIPVQRAVSGLFYLAPGTTDGLGGGKDNPSISGGSALDNLYVADGVNITDSAFGGIGTFSRVFGALGTGINTSFIKEVQVKTAGFEPQYGQSQGGIINIITQSGSRDYHGAFYGFASPKQLEAERRHADDSRQNLVGKLLHQEKYDIGADFSGYVPGARENLFFFGSFNPSVARDISRGAVGSGLLTLRGPEFALRTRTYNYSGKVEYLINSNHQVTFSIFGDPSRTNNSSFRTLNTDNTTADSLLAYGTRNMSFRYNGNWSPTLTFNASVGLGRTKFDETGFANINQITDRRGSDRATFPGCDPTASADPDCPARGNFSAVGAGFFEPTLSRTRRFDANLSKTHSMWGQHTLSVGYTFQRGFYEGMRERSGPKWTIPANGNGSAGGQTTNVQFRLRFRPGSTCPDAGPPNCVLFPALLNNGTTVLRPARLQVIRAEFGNPSFNTFSNYHAWYAQDTWRFNKYITGLFGLRWEQERLIGSPSLTTQQRIGYTFTDQWAPRLGVTVDPMGRGKTKAYYNYGRFFEYIPLDLAERSLSVEQDWLGATFLPVWTNVGGQRVATINQYGTMIPIIDQDHQVAGASVSIADPSNPIAPGTKLGFTDEHTIGFEQQLPRNFTLSVRFIKRDAKRIVEDAASVSPEANLAGIGQVYYIANISRTLDAAINLVPFIYTTGGPIPAGCLQSTPGIPDYNFDGTNNRSVCFAGTGIDANGNAINTPDGKPDGFPNAVRQYRAVEIELNKRFSNGWQGFFNWRIARLRGNFEGHLRNDNGQTDPAISSLFDFTTGDFGLLGDQFAIGPLNTDRRHIVNIFGSYAFGKDRGFHALNGLNLGLNVHLESGLPISQFNPHPVYLNTGEIPVGGRGKLGRTPFYTRFDVHTDYSWAVTENTKLKFIADFFNVFNSRKIHQFDENSALDFDAATLTNPPNPDFFCPGSSTAVCLRPRGSLTRAYHPPFNLRLGVRFEF